MKLNRDLEKLRAQQFSQEPLTFEALSARLGRTRKSLERIADAQEGDARLVAKASSEFLAKLRLFGDDFAVKMKALNDASLMDLSGIHTKEELQDRELIGTAVY